MNIIQRSLFVLVSIFIISPLFSFAAEPVQNKALLVADVSFRDVSIVSQQGNTLNIDFSLVNGKGVQNGVKYGVQLFSKKGESVIKVDEKVFDEKLLLAENTTIKRSVSYTAPSTLSGEYELLLISRNEANFPFAFSAVNKINLTASKTGVMVDSTSCKIQVGSEERRYTLNDIVTVNDATNPLTLTCDTTNNAQQTISANVQITTNKSGAFGDKVTTAVSTTKEISFNPGEKKNVSIAVPIAQSAGAYVANVVLVSDGVSSNPISIRYALQADTYVSILNMSLDHDSYEKGDTAKLSIVWSAPPAGVNITATLKNSIGFKCAEDVKQTTLVGATEVLFPITSSCKNPQASVQITNNSGDVLAQQKFSANPGSSTSTGKIVAIILVVLALTFVARHFLKHKKGNTESSGGGMSMGVFLPMILLAGSIVLIPFKTTEAATYVSGVSGNIISVVDVLPTSYAQNADISISWYVENQSSTITSPVLLRAVNNIGAGPGNPSVTLLTQTTLTPGQAYNPSPIINLTAFDAPGTDGVYTIEFETGVLDPVYIRATPQGVSQWTTVEPTVCGQTQTLDHLTTTSELIEFFSDPLGTVPLDVTGLGFRLNVRGVLTPVLSGTSYSITPGIDYHETANGYTLNGIPTGGGPGLLGGGNINWVCLGVGTLTGFGDLALSMHWMTVFNWIASYPFGFTSVPAPLSYELVYTVPEPYISYIREADTYPWPYNPPVQPGENITISWSSGSSGATCTGTGFSTGGAAYGAVTVPVTSASQTFSVSCTNIAGSGNASITFPPVANISIASPGYAPEGQPITINWNSIGVSSCTGTGFNTGGAISGSVTTSASYGDYSISCTGPSGVVNQSVNNPEPQECRDEFNYPFLCPAPGSCIQDPSGPQGAQICQ